LRVRLPGSRADRRFSEKWDTSLPPGFP